MKCEFCDGAKIPGVLLPTDFDDREPSCDGKVFVARHGECAIYGTDEDAAEAVSKVTGWPVLKSFDWIDNPDSEYKDDPKFKTYWRPYFAVTLAEVVAAVG